ncbi:MAG: N-acetylmuramic acid 6-phosphate etherase [Chloroflexi bacterium]|nr:N-acetylmuramic acid 6-phosphate etherase [Chloroflexota bacterium]MXX52072.1 N-acetylmuramic acid 6-phosphate etherase [Chloroflexota bacterium]MYA92185.1 N-acetylmuramic acid 6-phosphate etherase [Chloroflexota bacterium]MYC53994.1 N-acetylmuramic acid 6-phosphate etherase [Chloroflexota bacterium]MYD39460.1 N-acetylmuramic acid 6-phosphate etherase [Chloroflexota bacterium]
MERPMNWTTEQENTLTRDIDKLPTLEALQLINREDAQVAAAVAAELPDIARAVEMIVAALETGGRLFYVGAGTSGRLGMLDAAECVPTFSAPPELVQGLIAGGAEAMLRSIEGAEDDLAAGATDLRARQLSSADVVCGIAASGRTPYTIGALDYARSIGARSISIACNRDSPMAARADVIISVDVGPEVIAGSTRLKAGTAQKMILNMLSTASMIGLGKVYGNLMVDVKVTNAKLLRRAVGLVMRLTSLDEAAARQLLEAAKREVKTAVVMQQRSVNYARARQLLAENNGRLRGVVGDL